MKSDIQKIGTCETCYYRKRPGCASPSILKNNPEQGCRQWFRPSGVGATGDVLSADWADRVDRIKAYHQGCLKSFGDQMGYAFLAGVELNRLKDDLPHGKFTDFRKNHFAAIPDRSAQRYMAFGEALSKSATCGGFDDLKLLSDGHLDAKQQEKILKAVHEVADGKTLTQLYRDLGVIRDKKPVGRQDGEKPKRLSLAEQAELRKAQATEDWAVIDKALTVYTDKFTILPDADCLAQISLLERALTARKAWLKQPSNKRDAKAIEALFKS